MLKRLNDEYDGERLYDESKINGFYRRDFAGVDFSKLPVPPENKIIEI